MRDGILALTRAFEAADRLNRAALSALRAGQGLEALQPLFLEKNALQGELERLLPHLKGDTAAGDLGGALGEALAVQAAAARSEAQLSEALGRMVSSDGKVRQAYQQNQSPNPRQGWESAG